MAKKKAGSKPAADIKAIPAAVSYPADSDAISFLDLSAELRIHIYKEMLPDEDYRDGAFPDTPKRGGMSSTTFMASCRQIHQEASSILYGSKSFAARVDPSGGISFCKRYTRFDKINQVSFAGLNQVEILNLRIIVTSFKRFEAVKVQDALFAYLSHLRPDHKLHTLNVNIQVGLIGEYISDYSDSEFNSERRFRARIMREFRSIRPGIISRAHVAAFLTDPLRTIRNLRNGAAKGKFTLDFIGKSGRPWREIEGSVRALIQSDDAVPDYKIFHRYYQTLWSLIRDRDPLVPLKLGTAYRLDMNLAMCELASARVVGDIDKFRRAHIDLVKAINADPSKPPEVNHSYGQIEWQEKREQRVREVAYLTFELEQLLPAADADTSFFGYLESDDKLREWQSHGRQEEKIKKAERKRKREENALAGNKKSKTGTN